MVKVGILFLFLNLVGKLPAFHHWVLRWLWVCCDWFLLYWDMFPLNSLWGEFLSWVDGEFCQMLFCICWDDHVAFVFPFVNVVYQTDWLAYTDPSLWIWNEINSIIVYDLSLCTIGFGMPTFCWRFLHPYSSRILAYNFVHLCIFIWFWYQD